MAGGVKFFGTALKKVGDVILVTAIFLFLATPFCTTEGSKQIIYIGEEGNRTFSEEKTFCFRNTLLPGWTETWTQIQIRVNGSDKFKIKHVDEMELEDPGVWSWIMDSATSLLKEKVNETYLNVDLFSNKTCFKVEPSSSTVSYDILLTRRFDPQLILIFAVGMLLFFYAESLSRSQLFFYTSGLSLGVLASAIIVIFLLSRFLPKRSYLYLLMASGWSASLYLIQVTIRNLHFLLKEYLQYVLGYVIISGFIGFAICYKYGPPQEERSINLLNWTLQLCGLFLMYSGVQVRQVALAVIVVSFCIKNIKWLYTVFNFREVFKRRGKPEPRRLLTEEEFQRQGEVETEKALQELQKYCNSPEFNAWKVVPRLSKPKRFAKFAQGKCHLNPSEIYVHEQKYGLGSIH